MSRRKAAETVAALARGGLPALKAAEALLATEKGGYLHIRCSSSRLAAYREAAAREGLTLTAWVLRLCDAAEEG